jgi:signal transduction histidine kinase
VARALERRSLASEVQTNGQQLQQLQKDLEAVQHESQVNRTRGEIYGSIIHDINGPLTVISGLLHVIHQQVGDQDTLAGEDLEMVKDRLKRIARQATNCIEISRRYLGLLRGTRAEATHIWINQILHDVSDLARVHPSVRNHEFLVRPLAADVASPVHGTDLMQMLLNLSINAFQCTPQQHRVEISGQLLHEPFDLAAVVDGADQRFINRDGFHNHGPLLAVSVQDNGPGIAPDVMPRIFTPYFTTKSQQQGTGLGLCIVNRLLRESRAGLHVRTKPNQGSTFTVYLPAIQGHPGGPLQP